MTASATRWKGASIRVRFIVAILAAVLPVMAIGFAVLGASEIGSLRRALREETLTIALLVGRNGAADLAFDAREESVVALSQLEEDTDVTSAALYDTGGRLFSSWQRAGAHAPPAALDPETTASIRFEEDELQALLPVSREGTRYGTVRIAVSTARLDRRTRTYAATVAGLGAALALLSVVLASLLQRGLSRPILDLAHVADRIRAHGDFGVRATERGGPEIQALAGGFNAMLVALEERRRQRDLAEASWQRAARRLAALREIDTAILEGRPSGDVATEALRHVVEVAGVAWAAVIDVSPGASRARVVSARPPLADAVDPVATADEHAAFFRLLVNGQAVPVEAVASAMPAFLGAARAAGARHLLPIALRTREDFLGSLLVGLVGEPPPEELEFVHDLADVVAVSILHARLQARVEEHTAELERRVAERTARLAASVEELESFGYTVAHDLRAPLRSIHGYGSAVLEDAGPLLPESGRAYLRHILTSAERMDRLIQDLLAYSGMGLEPIVIGPVSLSAVVSEARAQIGDVLRARDADLVVEEPLAEVRGHRGTLVKVAAHLLLNAATFTRPGERPRIRVWTEARGDTVRLSVEDAGLGIAPEHRERIFRVFERLHHEDEFPGTGIGLAIVKRGAERCGGTSGVSSTLGRGSVFWIELPCARPSGRADPGRAGSGSASDAEMSLGLQVRRS